MAQKDLGRVVGHDGITPHIGENGNWFLGDADTGVKAKGVDGKTEQWTFTLEDGSTVTKAVYVK